MKNPIKNKCEIKWSKRHGFSLLELLTTVAIVGILAAIALPSYTNFIIRGNRSAAESQMMDLAAREQQYLLANRAYTTTLSELSFSLPLEVSSKYNAPTITLSQSLDSSCAVQADNGTAPSFVIAMVPLAGTQQASDGTLYLSGTGVKCPREKW